MNLSVGIRSYNSNLKRRFFRRDWMDGCPTQSPEGESIWTGIIHQ